MKLTIGSTSFDITSCERLRDLKIGFYLLIKVPRANIGSDELYALLNGTSETITITADDESEMSYTGFNKIESFEMNATEYIIKQSCVSEAMAQISLLKTRAENAEKANASMAQTLNNQQTVLGGCVDTINAHTEALTQQSEAISAQSKVADVLAEADMVQTATLESLLLEVIPTVVTDAVTVAVAEALATLTPSEGVETETTEADSEVIEDAESEVE